MAIVAHRCAEGHEDCSVSGSGGSCTNPVRRVVGANPSSPVNDPLDLAAGEAGGSIPKYHAEPVDQASNAVPIRPIDNWADKAAFVCATCMWFMVKGPVFGHSDMGRCRKKAPTLQGWPAMFSTDFCGDHKIR